MEDRRYTPNSFMLWYHRRILSEEFEVMMLGGENFGFSVWEDSLKVENLVVDHEEIRIVDMDLFLAFLLDFH